MNLSKGCFFFIVLFTGSVAQESCPTRNVTATCTGNSCADTRTCRKVGKTCQCVDNCGWTCVRIGCEFFGAPENGNVIYDPVNRTVGSTATFSCSPGYVLSGNAHLECLETKEWNATNDVSCAVQCLPLVAPENVHKDSSGTGYNERVEFSCDQGFSLNGESVLTCQSDGTWSADVPECTGSCDPTDLPYGDVDENKTVQVIHEHELFGTLTRNGGYLRVKCPEGYEHRGSRYMKCQGGEWTPYRRPSFPGRPPLCINV
ncbi:E-selectin-like [Apostichopus japonicus]|uniref:E-selectin-like n=1 Tax=Stichopus japonicus TaxID=307972 RepID=UPI003AB8783F